MAISRKDFLQHLEIYQNFFMEQIFLLGAYPDSPTVDNLISELATLCLIFDGVKLKPNKKPLPNDYLNSLMTKVDTIPDAKFLAGLHDSKLIQFKNDNDCEMFIKKWEKLRIDLAISFSSKGNNTRSYYSELLRQLI